MHIPKPAFFPSRARFLPTRGLARPLGAAEFPDVQRAVRTGLPAEELERATVHAVNAYEWTCRPEWKVRSRRVGDDMWFFIRSGTCRYRLGERTAWGVLRPGDLLLIPQGLAHAIAPSSTRRRVSCNTVHFFFRGVGGVDLLRIWGMAGVYRAAALRLDTMNRQLAAEFALKQPGWFPAMNAAIWQVLVGLIRTRTDLQAPAPALRRQWERLHPVLHVIDERLDDPDLRVSALAKIAHVSEAYLRRVFQEALGCGVVAFIQRRRLDRASRLLIETNRGLKEIAAASGFHSQTLFHRVFLSRFGVTPAVYRQAPPCDGTVPVPMGGATGTRKKRVPHAQKSTRVDSVVT